MAVKLSITIQCHDMPRSRLDELCAELRRELHALASQQIPEYAVPDGERYGVTVEADTDDTATALEAIIPAHKAGASIDHNEHLCVYQTVAQHVENHPDLNDWASDEAREAAIATNEMWVLRWYPDTPVGFCSIAAPTLAQLLAFASKDR